MLCDNSKHENAIDLSNEKVWSNILTTELLTIQSSVFLKRSKDKLNWQFDSFR